MARPFEQTKMLDSPRRDKMNYCGLYEALRQRLGRCTIRGVIAAFAVLIAFSLLLFGVHTKIPSLHRKLPADGQSKALHHVFNRTLGFEEILVVSLPERTDHRDWLILASAVSEIDVKFVDGVIGSTVPLKVLPPGYNEDVPAGPIGAWRGHVNALDQVVQRGLSSALIMEDDVDWDVRVKDILNDFARSSTVLLKSTYGAKVLFQNLPLNPANAASPYGDDWDVLWLGHCQMGLQEEGARVIHFDDDTVPETQYLHFYDLNIETPLLMYPNHTRVVMQSSQEACSLAYAVSQQGARRILHRLGLEQLDSAFDMMLRGFCDGSPGRQGHKCLGVLPQIFDHYRPKGAVSGDSDIGHDKDLSAVREKAETMNIRWSVRLNMERILCGETVYEDQFPDARIEEPWMR